MRMEQLPTETVIPPTSVEEKAQRRAELKARITLLMALPNEHQLKFNSYKDAKTLMRAIENRFGEVIEQTYERLQKLISQLEMHGEVIPQEDINQKFLRTLTVHLEQLILLRVLILLALKLDNEDLQQINPDDLEEMDLREQGVKTARPKEQYLVSIKGKQGKDAVKASAMFGLQTKAQCLDHVFRNNGASMSFKRCTRQIQETDPILQIMKKLMEDLLPLEVIPKEGKLLGKYLMVKEMILVTMRRKFKNRVMNQFCEMKGIKREFSVARTPQQNGVAERKIRTLIVVARTMLADSKLPTTFWAEAVNTTCNVQNKVLVYQASPRPFELFLGRKPALSFMRPFGCPVTILNTIDHLGKFDGKADEGFFVGYSTNSKAFRVFNSRTRIVEENLHVQFSENTSNIAGSGPNWLFDIDALTNFINYKPVVVGNQSNGNAGTKACDGAGKARMETVYNKNYILLPMWPADPLFSQNLKESSNAGFKPSGEEEKKDATNNINTASNGNSTNNVNAVSSTINVAVTKVNVVDPKTSIKLPDDPNMPELEDIVYSDDDEDVGAEADMNNLDAFMPISPIPTTRIHKDHPVEQIIGDLHSAPQIRRMTKNLEEHDNLFGSTKKSLCIEFEKMMHKKFQMSSIGELTFFLGLQVKKKEDGIFISQDKYVTEILKKFGFTNVKTASTPMETHKPLLKYADDRKSTIGGCQFLGCRLISWQCKKQTVVANSTTEAEYILLQIAVDSCKTSRTEVLRRPHINASCIKQFWATVKMKTINGEVQLQALVDGKKIIITEATVRRDLQLEDAEGGGPRRQETMGDTIAQTRSENVSKRSNDSLLAEVNTPRSDEDRLKLNELMDFVKRLEKKGGSRTHKLKILYKIGRFTRVISSDEASLVDETQGRYGDEDMFGVHDLDGDEVVVESEVATKKKDDEVSVVKEVVKLKSVKPKVTTAKTTTTKGILLQEPSESITTTTTIPSKDKGKGIMVKEHLKMKKKDQINFDEQEALRLLAEFNEEDRLAREKAQQVEEANIAWDDIQAKIDADYQLAKRLVNTFVDMDTELVEVRAEGSEIREESSSKRAGGELKQESTKKQKMDDDKEADDLKSLMKIVPNEEEVAIDAIPLTTKPPKDLVWRNLQGNKVLVWKLFDSCGVHYGRIVGIKRLLDDLRVTAAKLVLLVYVSTARVKLVLLVKIEENILITTAEKIKTAERVSTVKGWIKTEEKIKIAYVIKAMDSQSTQTIKLPILQPGEYDLWKMRMEQYLQCIDYTLWEIIENGNALIVTKTVDGKDVVIPPTSVEEKAHRRA
ncbi:ribonuclease H-like domain-containing protein [Tanacetum coccineum]